MKALLIGRFRGVAAQRLHFGHGRLDMAAARRNQQLAVCAGHWTRDRLTIPELEMQRLLRFDPLHDIPFDRNVFGITRMQG